MKSQLTRLLLILLTVTLASCEGGTTFTKKIENQSEDTLTVFIYSYADQKGPLSVPPGTAREIFWSDRMGMFVGEDYTCTDEIDSLAILVEGGKMITFDPLDDNRWFMEQKGGRNARVICTLVISGRDLQ